LKKTTYISIITLCSLASGYLYLSSKKTKTTIYKNIAEVKQNTSVNDSIYEFGRALFKSNCNSCHYIGMDKIKTAPALGGITKRRDKQWLYDYTRFSYKMYKEKDSIAIVLRSQNWGLMTAFPNLSEHDLDLLYYFIEKRYQKSLNGIPIEE
jgi:hypothetical protein